MYRDQPVGSQRRLGGLESASSTTAASAIMVYGIGGLLTFISAAILFGYSAIFLDPLYSILIALSIIGLFFHISVIVLGVVVLRRKAVGSALLSLTIMYAIMFIIQGVASIIAGDIISGSLLLVSSILIIVAAPIYCVDMTGAKIAGASIGIAAVSIYTASIIPMTSIFYYYAGTGVSNIMVFTSLFTIVPAFIGCVALLIYPLIKKPVRNQTAYIVVGIAAIIFSIGLIMIISPTLAFIPYLGLGGPSWMIALLALMLAGLVLYFISGIIGVIAAPIGIAANAKSLGAAISRASTYPQSPPPPLPAAPTDMMICPKCGHGNAWGSLYCYNCGEYFRQ